MSDISDNKGEQEHADGKSNEKRVKRRSTQSRGGKLKTVAKKAQFEAWNDARIAEGNTPGTQNQFRDWVRECAAQGLPVFPVDKSESTMADNEAGSEESGASASDPQNQNNDFLPYDVLKRKCDELQAQLDLKQAEVLTLGEKNKSLNEKHNVTINNMKEWSKDKANQVRNEKEFNARELFEFRTENERLFKQNEDLREDRNACQTEHGLLSKDFADRIVDFKAQFDAQIKHGVSGAIGKMASNDSGGKRDPNGSTEYFELPRKDYNKLRKDANAYTEGIPHPEGEDDLEIGTSEFVRVSRDKYNKVIQEAQSARDGFVSDGKEEHDVIRGRSTFVRLLRADYDALVKDKDRLIQERNDFDSLRAQDKEKLTEKDNKLKTFDKETRAQSMEIKKLQVRLAKEEARAFGATEALAREKNAHEALIESYQRLEDEKGEADRRAGQERAKNASQRAVIDRLREEKEHLLEVGAQRDEIASKTPEFLERIVGLQARLDNTNRLLTEGGLDPPTESPYGTHFGTTGSRTLEEELGDNLSDDSDDSQEADDGSESKTEDGKSNKADRRDLKRKEKLLRQMEEGIVKRETDMKLDEKRHKAKDEDLNNRQLKLDYLEGKLKHDQAAVEKQKSDLEKQQGSLLHQPEDIKKAQETLKKDQDALQKEQADLKEQRADLAKQKGSLPHDSQDLAKEQEALKDDQDSLKCAQQALQKDQAMLEKQKKNLQLQLNDFPSPWKELIQEQQEVEADLQYLDDLLRGYVTEWKDLVQERDTLEGNKPSSDEKEGNLLNELNELKGTNLAEGRWLIKEVKDSVGTPAEREDLNQAIVELNHRRWALKDKWQHYLNRSTQLSARKQRVFAGMPRDEGMDLKELRKDLSEKQKTIVYKERELTQLRDQLKNREKELNRKQAELEQKETQLDKKHQELEKKEIDLLEKKGGSAAAPKPCGNSPPGPGSSGSSNGNNGDPQAADKLVRNHVFVFYRTIDPIRNVFCPWLDMYLYVLLWSQGKLKNVESAPIDSVFLTRERGDMHIVKTDIYPDENSRLLFDEVRSPQPPLLWNILAIIIQLFMMAFLWYAYNMYIQGLASKRLLDLWVDANTGVRHQLSSHEYYYQYFPMVYQRDGVGTMGSMRLVGDVQSLWSNIRPAWFLARD